MKKKSARKRQQEAAPLPAVEGIVTASSLNLPPATDSGNAEYLASIYGDVLRFDHKRLRWLVWNKKRHQWGEDESHAVRVFAIQAARRRRQLVARITDKDEAAREFRWTYESENRSRIDAALEIAKSLPPISDSGDGWDGDPWQFGVANGVVDLRTGRLREETQQDRITKHSPVAYDPNAECLRFELFLGEILNYVPDLFFYVQKAIGYCLTALVQEQCLFCCYGPGANGKSTLFRVLHYIFGDYAQNLSFSALELKNRNSNDLVKLADCRFATASETNEGVRLNEARIKALTGGDPITARRLYHESFTFLPTHKLWLSFNHKPVIADDSEGMWRRVRLIPFTRQFKPEEQEKTLPDKLKDEAPGILAWAVRGCLDWQKEGLGMPSAVAEATAAYREESDHVGEFIEDCCVVEPDAEVLSGKLWQRYREWVSANEEIALVRSAFTERLKKHGVKPGRSGHGGQRVWGGIRLQESDEAADGDMVTHGDAISDNFPTRGSYIEKNTKTPSPSVTTSPCPQKPAPDAAIGAAAKRAVAGGDVKRRVLEVEI